MGKPRRKRPYTILPGRVDCFPLKTREPTQRDLIIGNATPSITYESHHAIWPRIIDSVGNCAEDSAVKDALLASKIYKSWQHGMPFLKDVPIMKKFRSGRLSADDLPRANDVILTHGMWLPAGQILYHGGCFDSQRATITDRPISATLVPSVALVHAIKDRGQIAVFRIADSESVRAFVYSSRGYQLHTLEHEILLQSRLELSPISSQEILGRIVSEYEVRPK